MPKSPNQTGYITIILILILLPLIGLVFFKPKVTAPTFRASNACVLEPDPSKNIAFNGSNYQLIFSNAPVISGEVDTTNYSRPNFVGNEHHLVRTGVSTTDSKEIFKVNLDAGGNAESVTWVPKEGLGNLIFVKLDNSQIQNAATGYYYFDIYLKSGQLLPPFIADYCIKNLPVSPVLSDVTTSTETFPPQTVNSDDITDKLSNESATALPSNTIFYLFAYETSQSPSFLLSTEVHKMGRLQVPKNGPQKAYTVYYNPLSAIKYLALRDESDTSNNALVFKYVTADFYQPSTANTSASPIPSDASSLKLTTFSFRNIYPWGWWTPECKPAIYLYPQTPTQVQVKVNPKGYLTYTKPVYPTDGWNVLANPNGNITSAGQTFDYLYYESKIRDDVIDKPTQGYVVQPEELTNLYSKILPQLGLNDKETQDFKKYWNGILPQSNYYFVGIMTPLSIDKIEPLTIVPQPQTTIRVRLYFQPLDQKIDVAAPTITTPTRSGFTLVEWGGLVKTDPSHPFTCSQ